MPDRPAPCLAPTMPIPGATMSGLVSISSDGPLPEKAGTSCLCKSKDPTVKEAAEPPGDIMVR